MSLSTGLDQVRGAQMRRPPVHTKGIVSRTIWRVAAPETFAGEWSRDIRLLVRVTTAHEMSTLQQIVKGGLSNLGVLTRDAELFEESSLPTALELGEALADGDVVALSPGRPSHVLYRESDVHHTVFLTNRCNSFCVMCSQPPSRQDDSWLVEEAIAVAMHFRRTPTRVGFTGGEPLLLGSALRRVLDAFAGRCPAVGMDVLTNARLFADRQVAKGILEGMRHNVSWMVPLYGHVDAIHDRVVQSPAAFDETLAGLLTLQENKQPVQLRIVLIEPTLRILPELCAFIGRNLPFVREVALMGCEPTGHALANRNLCETDMLEWHGELEHAVRILARMHVPTIIMNLPLCTLPRTLWSYSHQSISDWKRTFTSECAPCTVRHACAGLFAWHQHGWKPGPLHPIVEDVA